MKFSKSQFFLISTLFLFLISACSGGGGSSDSGGTGDLSVSLTDSAGSYKAVYITVDSLEVHTGGNDNNKNNWQTIPMDKDTVNLCDLTNGVFEELGSIRLDTGKYTQMRLHLSDESEDTDELNILSQKHPLFGNYVITEDNTIHELKIPSGFKTGVKIVKGFTINDNSTTEIILDFDAMSSVVEAGNSGQWLLKPTIKVGELDDYSIINGRVTNDSDGGIGGVYVSAQIYDGSQDEKDKVVVQAGTLTDGEGYYSIFVMPGTYNLVAYIDGKEVDFVKVETVAGQTLDNPLKTDFQLADASDMGTIEGEVFISSGDAEQYAKISYRQNVDCSECVLNEKVELKSINASAEYETQLPTGSYTRVSSSYDYTTQTFVFVVNEGENSQDFHDIVFNTF